MPVSRECLIVYKKHKESVMFGPSNLSDVAGVVATAMEVIGKVGK